MNRKLVLSRHLTKSAVAMLALFALGAAPASEPSDPAKVVAPFVDEQVVGVVRVDASRVDLKALESWLVEHLRAAQPKENAAVADVLKEVAGELQKIRVPMEQAVAGFVAAGGREVFVILSPLDIGGDAPPPVVIPLGKGADADKLLAMVGTRPGGGTPEPMAERVGDVILFGPPPTRARLKAAHDDASKRAANPELLAALKDTGPDVAVQLAVAPSADARKAFEQLAPTLPPQLGGGATAEATRGLRWAAVSIQLPPQPAIRGVVQTDGAEAAAALEGVLRKAAADTVKTLDAMAAKAGSGDGLMLKTLARLVGTLTPARDGDRVVLALDDRALSEVARVAGAGLAAARAQAFQVQSLTNIRQLLVACHQWAATHKGEWPDDLAAAATAMGVPHATTNPRVPKTGYTYVTPPKDTKSPSSRVVIYEESPAADGRGVGYMDGHSEWVKEDAFQRALKAQQEQDKAAAK